MKIRNINVNSFTGEEDFDMYEVAVQSGKRSAQRVSKGTVGFGDKPKGKTLKEKRRGEKQSSKTFEKAMSSFGGNRNKGRR